MSTKAITTVVEIILAIILKALNIIDINTFIILIFIAAALMSIDLDSSKKNHQCPPEQV